MNRTDLRFRLVTALLLGGAAALCACGDDDSAQNNNASCNSSDPQCDADGDGVPASEDCDDSDPNRFPGNPEAPNACPSAEFPDGLLDPGCGDGIDQDCDGQDVECVVDADCDGYSPPADCNDEWADIHPDAVDICNNGTDENCSGVADEGCTPCDLDGDGFERDDPANNCPGPDYPLWQLVDCDDTDSGVFPGLTFDCDGDEGGQPLCAALQLCDGKDNDCDGDIDEGCPDPACDLDSDGFMNAAGECSPDPGREDCDDSDPLIYPGAPDRCGDSILQNCTGDTLCSDDSDGDGYNAVVDCQDDDPLIHPGALELCNGVDDDCDGLIDEGNPDATGQAMEAWYCNDDNDGLCGDPLGPGICVCTKAVPLSTLDATNRADCPGEDLYAVASPRCLFAPQPELEQCDELDHDCNGVSDDPEGRNLLELGQPCGSDTGQCVAGTVVGCQLDATTLGALNPHWVCSADQVPPAPEQCENGLDEDCDGVPDNGCP